ncbi:MAG: glycoside hydrolase [Ruminococcaceae bacterium]|nr:glycoside hydrolase [Oscillospiraceae bacterium]
MKKFTFGTPEKFVPSLFCKKFNYSEKEINYPINKICFKTNKRGCVLTLPLDADEQIYGLGLQLKCFNLRGKKITIRPNADPVSPTGDSHAPVPFFVSTAGYGIYIDTARFCEFHFGSSQKLTETLAADNSSKEIAISTDELYSSKLDSSSNITIQIPAADGVDIYIIEGKNITEIVAQYNMLSGGGCSVPEWGLSAIYRCYGRYHQDEVLSVAKKLKDDDFAIGIIGLEPGWQTQSYSCSYIWSDERFPNPQKTVDTLKDMGYHINLWEHAFVHPTSPIYKDLLPYSADYSVWKGCVPDLSLKEARNIFADYHKKLVDMGIDGFKLDECDGSDITGGWSFPNCAEFPSGLDGEQYHSLFGVFYMQTMLKALKGHKTFSEVRNAGALSSSYPFVLYSDLYDHKDFIRGCATSGFSGILWTPEVRDAQSKEEFIRRLQSNVFSVQCLINAWYCENLPWEIHGCEKEVKELLDLRESLKPMLSAAFEKYEKTGVPPVRALVSDYTDDSETHNIDDEYIFCDNLIVAPIPSGETSREVYLPQGKWCDYFTKKEVPCGRFTVKTENIPVYEKI